MRDFHDEVSETSCGGGARGRVQMEESAERESEGVVTVPGQSEGERVCASESALVLSGFGKGCLAQWRERQRDWDGGRCVCGHGIDRVLLLACRSRVALS